jgi:hypothetical protein
VFVALRISIQRAYAVISSVACLAPQIFFPHGLIFEKEKGFEHQICSLIFSVTSETFLILKRKRSA